MEVGLVHLQIPRTLISNPPVMYSEWLNEQIMFHEAKRTKVYNHRDMRKSSATFVVTPRGVFLPGAVDYSLTFFLHVVVVQIWTPTLRAVPLHTSSILTFSIRTSAPLCAVLGKQGGTFVSVVKLPARDRTLNEWFKVSSEQLSQLINLLMAVHVCRGEEWRTQRRETSSGPLPFQVKTVIGVTANTGAKDFQQSARVLVCVCLWWKSVSGDAGSSSSFWIASKT